MNSQPISIEKRFLETAKAFHGNSHPFHLSEGCGPKGL